MVKNLPTLRETWVWSLGWKDPLEKGKATHSSILAQRIPWTILFGSQTVGHDWATFTFHGDSLKKIGIKLQYDLAMPLLGIYPEKTTIQKVPQYSVQHYWHSQDRSDICQKMSKCFEVWKVEESEVAQSCPIFCSPMDYSLPGSSVHGIFQARILEWVAISFSRRSSWPRNLTQVSSIVGSR